MLGLVLIGLAQGLLLWSTMRRGWYNDDDFALLMNASHRSLDWSYLKSPINDHLLPGLRLEFWLLRHLAPLNHGLTIGVRLVLQETITALFAATLVLLVGVRRRVLLVTALFALCPLVITNALWLTVALSVLPAEVLVLLALFAHIKYAADGRFGWAALSGASLLGCALFWEKAAALALMLPVVSFCYVYGGRLPERLRSALTQWRGWLATVLPPVLFAAFFLSQGYGGATKPIAASADLNVLWMQWSRVVAPSVFGGPWHWFYFQGVPLGYAQTSRLGLILTQVGFLVVVLLGVRLNGWKSLLGWLLPLLPLVVGTSLVALGRYQFFGLLISTILRYAADLAVPLFLGLALAVATPAPAGVRRRSALRWRDALRGQPRLAAASAGRSAASGRKVLAVLSVLAIGGWLFGSLTSVSDFDRHWSADPTHRYVTTLRQSIDAAGPSLNLYDTTVSQSVLPIFFGPHWHLSDFLPLSGKVPTLDGPGTEPLVADDSGHLVPAAFVPAVTRGPPPGGLCTYLIQGAGTFRIPFDRPAPAGDGFLRIDYLQPRPSVASVTVEDAGGYQHLPVGGSHVLFGDLLSHVTLRLPVTAVAAVTVHTDGPDTHLCIGKLTVGAPFPVGGR